MSVRFTPRARYDLASILDYIDQRSPRGARNVKRALQQTLELIGQAPESGRRSELEDTRVLPAGRYPYLIYWGRDRRRRVDRAHTTCRTSAVAGRLSRLVTAPIG